MAVSVFDLFSIGIGPSSSHTVGPMRAAREFVLGLQDADVLATTCRVQSELYGSLAFTGVGHGTDRAVLLGLEGETPEEIQLDTAPNRVEAIHESGTIRLLGGREVQWAAATDLLFERRQSLPYHPNGMRFTAFGSDGETLQQRVFYSVGGGFVVNEEAAGADVIVEDSTRLPYRFRSGAELLTRCAEMGGGISDVMRANETAWREGTTIESGLLELWHAMDACIERGCTTRGILPGGLRVRRRAADWSDRLAAKQVPDPLEVMDWVSVWAVAVNE